MLTRFLSLCALVPRRQEPEAALVPLGHALQARPTPTILIALPSRPSSAPSSHARATVAVDKPIASRISYLFSVAPGKSQCCFSGGMSRHPQSLFPFLACEFGVDESASVIRSLAFKACLWGAQTCQCMLNCILLAVV